MMFNEKEGHKAFFFLSCLTKCQSSIGKLAK